uniref:Uncharacterized protein n=1 Tax=Aegilops tauschii subsp. strangulata TaxID=200361 RepID=A0A453IGB7_AEGTS
MFVLLLKFEEFPGGGEEYRHIESLVFSSTSWGGRVVLSSSDWNEKKKLQRHITAAKKVLHEM